jgi:hypothetical protein
MRRLSVGLTGLGFVLMLVLFSSVGVRPDVSAVPVGSESETLSVLGVAPSSGEDELLRRNAQRLLERPQHFGDRAPTRT